MSSTSENDRTPKSKSCGSHAKCMGDISDIKATVTEIHARLEDRNACSGNPKSRDAHKKCDEQMSKIARTTSGVDAKMDNLLLAIKGITVCRCRCAAAISPRIVTTASSQKLDLLSPVTIAAFSPEPINREHDVSSTLDSPILLIVEPRDVRPLSEDILSSLSVHASIIADDTVQSDQTPAQSPISFSDSSQLSSSTLPGPAGQTSIDGSLEPGNDSLTFTPPPQDEALLPVECPLLSEREFPVESVSPQVHPPPLTSQSTLEDPLAGECPSPWATTSPSMFERLSDSGLSSTAATVSPSILEQLSASGLSSPSVITSPPSIIAESTLSPELTPTENLSQIKTEAPIAFPTSTIPTEQAFVVSTTGRSSPDESLFMSSATASPISTERPTPIEIVSPITSTSATIPTEKVPALSTSGRSSSHRSQMVSSTAPPPSSSTTSSKEAATKPVVTDPTLPLTLASTENISSTVTKASPAFAKTAVPAKNGSLSTGSRSASDKFQVVSSAALAPVPRKNLFLPDPKAASFSPAKSYSSTAKSKTPSPLLPAALSLHSPKKQVQADKVKDTGMSGTEMLSLPLEKIDQQLYSSPPTVPEFIKNEQPNNDPGAAARRQYAGATTGQSSFNLSAKKELSPADATTGRPQLYPTAVEPFPSAGGLETSMWSGVPTVKTPSVASFSFTAGPAVQTQSQRASFPTTSTTTTSTLASNRAVSGNQGSISHIDDASGAHLGISLGNGTEAPSIAELDLEQELLSLEIEIPPRAQASTDEQLLSLELETPLYAEALSNDFSSGDSGTVTGPQYLYATAQKSADNLPKTGQSPPAQNDKSAMASPVRKNFFVPQANVVDQSPPSIFTTDLLSRKTAETETSLACELNESIWAQASSSPARPKAPNTAYAKLTPRNQGGKGPKEKPVMPAILKGTEYEAQWNNSSGPPKAMPYQPPLDTPTAASPTKSTSSKAAPAVRKSFFINEGQSDNLAPLKPKVPDFLNNDMGAYDPGAAARKQYGGMAVNRVGPTDNASEKPSNAVAAPIPRSSSPQLPGLGTSRWAQPAAPVARSSSPQLPGLGASKWAQPAQEKAADDDKPFIQPTPPGRKNNGGRKRGGRW